MTTKKRAKKTLKKRVCKVCDRPIRQIKRSGRPKETHTGCLKKKNTKKKTKKKAAKKTKTKVKHMRGMKPKFHFFTRSGAEIPPFARGMIPSEVEIAPILDRIHASMVEHYGSEGRQVFYAFVRDIRPRNTVMKRVMQMLKKIQVAKQHGQDYSEYLEIFEQINIHLAELRQAMEDKEYDDALDAMREAERASSVFYQYNPRHFYQYNSYRRNAKKKPKRDASQRRDAKKKKQQAKKARASRAQARSAASPSIPPKIPWGRGDSRWDRDFNLYLSFALAAVSGRMGPADELMRQHRRSVYRVAERLHQILPIKRMPILYRGILIEPTAVMTVQDLPHQTFVSFSEDRDIACLFADRDSAMALMIRLMHSNYRGALIDGYTPESTDEILFHWQWGLGIPLADGRVVTLNRMRLQHPDPALRAMDFDRALKEQKEVMLKPSKESYDIIWHKDAGCPATHLLDQRFTRD